MKQKNMISCQVWLYIQAQFPILKLNNSFINLWNE